MWVLTKETTQLRGSQAVIDHYEAHGKEEIDNLIKEAELRDRELHTLFPEKDRFLIITGNHHYVIVKVDADGKRIAYAKMLKEFIEEGDLQGILLPSDNSLIDVQIRVI